jgi:hypothetical protein
MPNLDFKLRRGSILCYFSSTRHSAGRSAILNDEREDEKLPAEDNKKEGYRTGATESYTIQHSLFNPLMKRTVQIEDANGTPKLNWNVRAQKYDNAIRKWVYKEEALLGHKAGIGVINPIGDSKQFKKLNKIKAKFKIKMGLVSKREPTTFIVLDTIKNNWDNITDDEKAYLLLSGKYWPYLYTNMSEYAGYERRTLAINYQFKKYNTVENVCIPKIFVEMGRISEIDRSFSFKNPRNLFLDQSLELERRTWERLANEGMMERKI